MKRELRFTPTADAQLDALETDPAQKNVLKQVRKTLGYLETNPRHPSLQTHEYHSLTQCYEVKVFEAYVQQKTAAAYRVFFHYGPDEQNAKGKRTPIITIVAITPHP
jgi:hypothetical protein